MRTRAIDGIRDMDEVRRAVFYDSYSGKLKMSKVLLRCEQ